MTKLEHLAQGLRQMADMLESPNVRTQSVVFLIGSLDLVKADLIDTLRSAAAAPEAPPEAVPALMIEEH